MKITKLSRPQNDRVIDIHEATTFLDLYRQDTPQGYPTIFQIGGALGPLLRHEAIHHKVLDHQAGFYEPYIHFMADFCPVDYMRFMCRFTLRNLNIVNDNILEIYGLIDGLTQKKTPIYMLNHLDDLLSKKGASLGENLLYTNLQTLLSWYKSDVLDHISGHCSHSICRPLMKAQCINACPAHIHIPGFVALMKAERYKEAYGLMRQENPLSSVCGYVCARPCEDKCRRGEITATVGVRALQRFISTQALKTYGPDDALSDNGKHIGIIGGGPSGLTAAYYLKRTGYQVTIYEKEKQLGGLLAHGLPQYRLPKNAIEEEINTLLACGIHTRVNTTIGKDMTFEDLKANHQALLISTGRPTGLSLDINHDNVQTAIHYLKAVRQGKVTHAQGHLVVVGGGDVAMDVCRTARRLGNQVTLVSLESYASMVASTEEKTQGRQEGVTFVSGYAIASAYKKTIHLKRCLEVKDCYGHFKPKFEDSNKTIDRVDGIIVAIGQTTDLSFLPGSLQDQAKAVLGDGLYMSGDVLKATTVIDAIAQGKAAALKIHQDLGGKALYTCQDIVPPSPLLHIHAFDYDQRAYGLSDPETRLKDFDIVNQNYSLEDALFEAQRCMRCDQNSMAPLRLGRQGQ